jgi:hypothetical protein
MGMIPQLVEIVLLAILPVGIVMVTVTVVILPLPLLLLTVLT